MKRYMEILKKFWRGFKDFKKQLISIKSFQLK